MRFRKRTPILSITHKLNSYHDSEFYVGWPRQASPDDGVARWRIVGPSEVLEPFHNRCPLILEPKDYDRWLAPAESSHLPIDLMRTYPSESMKAWRVAPLKGVARNWSFLPNASKR
jgi:hypothetical protein